MVDADLFSTYNPDHYHALGLYRSTKTVETLQVSITNVKLVMLFSRIMRFPSLLRRIVLRRLAT
jgi:hypothetical protein